MADDIYFTTPKRENKENSRSERSKNYLEKIEEEQLKKAPGELAFSDIITEDRVYHADKKNSHKKKKSKAVRFIKVAVSIILTVAIIISALLAGTVSYVTGNYRNSEFSDNQYVTEGSLMYSDYVYNILLLGIDTLETESSSRSDAMILMSVDTRNHSIKLTSFLRDSYVYIPGYGQMKLNAACVYGGAQLVCDTIEYNFGIRIDDYAKVGYDMFIKIIDAVGGISIPEIDETEARVLCESGYPVEPGENVHADGEFALIYCRIRKGQSDFYRTERQREVVSLVLKKLIFSNPLTLLSTAEEIAQTIECSIKKTEMFTLALKILFCLFGDISQLTIPADGTWYNDTKNYQAVLILDFDTNKEQLNDFIYN